MEEAFEAFLRGKERRPSTILGYRTIWRLHVPVSLKSKAVKAVTPEDIERAKQACGAKHRTANKVATLLAAVFAKSGRWADNPARQVARYETEVRTRRLSGDELPRVWAACETEPAWGDFSRLLILTGARRDAFCAMRWVDLSLDAGIWLVPATWSKNKREMAVPLAGTAVDILRERRNAALLRGALREWVWPSPDSATGHIVNPEKPWRRVLEAAGSQNTLRCRTFEGRAEGSTARDGWGRCNERVESFPA